MGRESLLLQVKGRGLAVHAKPCASITGLFSEVELLSLT